MRNLHLSPGFHLFNDDMMPIINRKLSLNLLVNEIKKIDKATIILYTIGQKGEYKFDKAIKHSKNSPFTGFEF